MTVTTMRGTTMRGTATSVLNSVEQFLTSRPAGAGFQQKVSRMFITDTDDARRQTDVRGGVSRMRMDVRHCSHRGYTAFYPIIDETTQLVSSINVPTCRTWRQLFAHRDSKRAPPTVLERLEPHRVSLRCLGPDRDRAVRDQVQDGRQDHPGAGRRDTYRTAGRHTEV